MLNETRLIDLTVGDLITIINTEVRKVVREEIANMDRPPQFANTLDEVAVMLGISKGTAHKIARSKPDAVERISNRKYRYNVTALMA